MCSTVVRVQLALEDHVAGLSVEYGSSISRRTLSPSDRRTV